MLKFCRQHFYFTSDMDTWAKELLHLKWCSALALWFVHFSFGIFAVSHLWFRHNFWQIFGFREILMNVKVKKTVATVWQFIELREKQQNLVFQSKHDLGYDWHGLHDIDCCNILLVGTKSRILLQTYKALYICLYKVGHTVQHAYWQSINLLTKSYIFSLCLLILLSVKLVFYQHICNFYAVYIVSQACLDHSNLSYLLFILCLLEKLLLIMLLVHQKMP